MPSIFITGSGKRIGKNLALNFAKKGWDVAIHYNASKNGAEQTAAKIRDLERKTIVAKADLTDLDETKSAFARVFDEFGVPNVLINNAGVFPKRASLEELDMARLENTMNINLSAVLHCSKLFAEVAREGARIVNIASVGALETWRGRIDYNLSKSGVAALTKILARDLAPRISVNAVCPGSIFMEDEPSTNDKFFAPLEKIPMGRYGTTCDVFDAAYFFAAFSPYITGQIIAVDGGLHNSL